MSIKKLKEASRKPNPVVIEYLEECLGHAKEGTLSMFIATHSISGEELGQFVSGLLTSEDHLRALGLLETTKVQVLKSLSEDLAP